MMKNTRRFTAGMAVLLLASCGSHPGAPEAPALRLAESDAAETRYIVRRALRTLSKRTAEEP